MTNKKNRHILVGPLNPPYTGQSVAFRLLCEGMAEKTGCSPAVVDLSRTGSFEGVSIGRTLDYIPLILKFMFYCITCRGKVYITIAQSKAGFLRDYLMVSIATFFCRPIIFHLHGGAYGNFYASCSVTMQNKIKRLLYCAESIVILGENLKPMFDFLPSLSSKLKVVHNGVSPVHLAPTEYKTLPGADEPITLLYLSNLIESKGYLDLLLAVAILKEKPSRKIKLEFYGNFLTHPDDVRVKTTSQAKELFDNIVAKNGLDKDVFYGGPVHGVEKEKILQKADIFILPTGYNNEGEPIAIIEAMMFATPVIATKYRAIPDLLKEGETGLFAEYKNPGSIAAAVTKIIAEPDRYKTMSRNARYAYKENFTSAHHLKNMLALFD